MEGKLKSFINIEFSGADYINLQSSFVFSSFELVGEVGLYTRVIFKINLIKIICNISRFYHIDK